MLIKSVWGCERGEKYTGQIVSILIIIYSSVIIVSFIVIIKYVTYKSSRRVCAPVPASSFHFSEQGKIRAKEGDADGNILSCFNQLNAPSTIVITRFYIFDPPMDKSAQTYPYNSMTDSLYHSPSNSANHLPCRDGKY